MARFINGAYTKEFIKFNTHMSLLNLLGESTLMTLGMSSLGDINFRQKFWDPMVSNQNFFKE